MKTLSIVTALIFSGLVVFKYLTTNQPQNKQDEEVVMVTDELNKSQPVKLKPVKKYPKKGQGRKQKSSSQKDLELKEVVKMKTGNNPTQAKRTKYDFKDFVYVDQNENLYVESVIVDGDDVVSFGDVLVGDKEDVLNRASKGESVSLNKPIPWPEGEVPYVISSELDDIKEDIKEAMNVLREATGGLIMFGERDNQENYLSFEKGNQNCYSYVGMRGGKQKVSLSLRCGVGEILHELMHAIGFFHEQNREDRDNYIEVHFYNIDEKFHPQFKKIPNSWQHLFGTEFDFQSIMLYPPTAFSMYDGDYSMTTIEGDAYEKQVGILSEMDIQRIKLLYSQE